jgi:hypothetical protein
MWKAGATVKQIAYDTGKTVSGVKNQRKTLKLPKRRTDDKTHMLRVNVNDTLFRKIGSRAMGRQQTVSDYIRMLLIRDVGGLRE